MRFLKVYLPPRLQTLRSQPKRHKVEAGGNLERPNCSEANNIFIQVVNRNGNIQYSRPSHKTAAILVDEVENYRISTSYENIQRQEIPQALS